MDRPTPRPREKCFLERGARSAKRKHVSGSANAISNTGCTRKSNSVSCSTTTTCRSKIRPGSTPSTRPERSRRARSGQAASPSSRPCSSRTIFSSGGGELFQSFPDGNVQELSGGNTFGVLHLIPENSKRILDCHRNLYLFLYIVFACLAISFLILSICTNPKESDFRNYLLNKEYGMNSNVAYPNANRSNSISYGYDIIRSNFVLFSVYYVRKSMNTGYTLGRNNKTIAEERYIGLFNYYIYF